MSCNFPQQWQSTLLWLAAFLTFQGCDDGVMDTALATPERAAHAELQAPVDLFDGQVPTTWTLQGNVPDSAWIFVEVISQTGYVRNPYCYTVKGFCDGPETWLEGEGPFGPLQFGGEVRVAFRWGQQPPPLEGQGISLYSPTDDPTGQVGHFLFQNTLGPASFWTNRQALQTFAGSPTSPTTGYWPVYIHTGGGTVQVRRVPTPLRVIGPSHIPQNKPGT